jgi:hypothetical protein
MRDDKTPFLHLPLPAPGENFLEDDGPRIRASFVALDANAAQIASGKADKAEMQAATAAIAAETAARQAADAALQEGKANKVTVATVGMQTLYDYFNSPPVPNNLELPIGTAHTFSFTTADIQEFYSHVPTPPASPADVKFLRFSSASGDWTLEFRATVNRRDQPVQVVISAMQKQTDGHMSGIMLYNGAFDGSGYWYGGGQSGQSVTRTQIDYINFTNYDMSITFGGTDLTSAAARGLNLWKSVSREVFASATQDLAEVRDGILGEITVTTNRISSLEATLEVNAAESVDALAAHDESAAAHDALVRRITVGDISPIIGVCQVATGNSTGLWYNVDADGQPVTPNRRYFDYHPIFDSMRRVLIDDQVMVRIDPFWFKCFKPDAGPFAGKPCRVIAPGQADGFKPYPAFLDTAGNVVPLYIGAFSATDEGSSKAGSRPGKMPLVSLDFPTMRTRCLNRNTGGVSGFRMWDIYHYSALCHLFLTENCTPESQMLYGRGWVDSSSAVTVDDDHQPNWRGLTCLWGNVWEMVDGFRLDASRKIEVYRNDGAQTYVATGKTAPSYDGSNPQYVVTNQEGSGDGWDMGDGYFPLTQASAKTSGTFPDYFYGGYGSAGNVLYVGGTWHNASGAGLFCWNLNLPAGGAYTYIGCRLAKS